MKSKIYLLPGRTGRIDGLIGTMLLELGYSVVGHNIDDSFQKLKFSQQVEKVKNDLNNSFFDKESRVIASSYGAYLFLHAVLERGEFKGKALLFSPMLGRSRLMPNRPVVFPSRSKKILEYKKENKLPFMDIEVHTGLEDEICDPELAKEIFEEMESSKLVLVANASHRLDKDYIKNILVDFCST